MHVVSCKYSLYLYDETEYATYTALFQGRGLPYSSYNSYVEPPPQSSNFRTTRMCEFLGFSGPEQIPGKPILLSKKLRKSNDFHCCTVAGTEALHKNTHNRYIGFSCTYCWNICFAKTSLPALH